ncbi:MAG TPA: transglutaminase-like cysteine peptidase [Rhizomicrobium sp.]|nr:transglutaminase-like cysteine peptidase [Rhizomicrobium sp.]
MALGLPTAAPDGYVALCQTSPSQCPESRAPAGLQQAAFVVPQAHTGLTPAQWNLLNAVNLQVNTKVRYVTDEERFGKPDVWSPAVTEGDCEDYALAKRQMLWAAGWATGDLSMAVVDSPVTGPHAVLVANTTQGAYVLDSANSWIMPWKEADYTWITAQDPEGHWRVAGENAQAMLLATAFANRQAGNQRVALAGVTTRPAATPSAAATAPAGSGGQVPDVRTVEPGGR